MNPSVPPLEPGTRLESFEIDGVLGAGGFGITYKAHDTRLERNVAIKEYLPVAIARRDTDSVTVTTSAEDDKTVESYQQGLERFLDEARTLAKFNAASVVRVIYFFTANNTAYMVMQYEEGKDLGQHLKTRDWPLPEGEIRGLLGNLLFGLQEVHQAGVLHRDIKPANIYIRADGSPVLLDFGSARQHASEQLTQEMTAMVSSGYAPYEQYNRRGRQGPWSDLYSLGSTFYYCLSGRHPVDSLERFMAMHNGEPDPLQPLPELCGEHYSDELLHAVSWMLSTNIDARPQTAEELINAVCAQEPGTGFARQTHLATESAPMNPTRPPVAWDESMLTRAESDLANHLGPMAKVVVKRAARSTGTLEELYEKLASSIESDSERARFLAKASTNEPITGQASKGGPAPSWDQDTLDRITEQLTEYIGPVASILVKKAARKADSIDTLYQFLSGHIDSDRDREKFLNTRETG